MALKSKIHGDDIQLVEITLGASDKVRAEPGSMLYMQSPIKLSTNTGGGLWKGFKRMLTGDRFFISTFETTNNESGMVAFAAPYPGKIIELKIKSSKNMLCQRDSFLCAEKSVDIDIAFTKRLGAGFFGGEGFILQKLSGSGDAFIHAGGTVIEKTLKQGESLRVDTGSIVAFEEGVDYDIKFIGGFKNALFGGEGIFLATLTGPGKVYLQSLPFARLARRIAMATHTHKNKGESRGVAGLGNSVLGGLLSGDGKI